MNDQQKVEKYAAEKLTPMKPVSGVNQSEKNLNNTTKIVTHAKEYCIEVEGKTSIYLQDKQGNITLERYPWIEKFLAVKPVGEKYEILYQQKNGQFFKWIVNHLGKKQSRQQIEEQDIVKLAQEFSVNIDSLSVNKSASADYPKPEKLIIHCCYHKVATSSFTQVFNKICKKFNWEFQESYLNKKLQPETKIFLANHSNIDWSNLPPYIGSHIIRDPRDVIISGYFYHLWCHEKWCHTKKLEYDNRSYQELLNSVSQDEGITLEMKRVKGMIKNMLAWNYSNPNIIEIRLEELAVNEKAVFEKVFQKYGFNQEQIDLLQKKSML
ncbi:hypothetical protein [Planktothrix prolifica]|uniref:hypothetical protein n=1 Tax=Planktothrix prolifica TaxID=54307 RepID=UPI0004795A8D|nr:hypothetical protein [Planktothrix prolifica]